MKLLILGSNGMAGHVMKRYFQENTNYTVYATSRERRSPDLYLDARDAAGLKHLIKAVSPDVIINCIGILNEDAARREVDAYLVNGIFPHLVASAAEANQAKVIHISTDCVFSGAKGKYEEDDQTDGTSVYARSKALGELRTGKHLTVRTSIIGPEIRQSRIGLYDWFMNQQGTVKGYAQVMWNGVTTLELAKAVHHWVEHPVSGLVHLCAPETVSKYELLKMIQRIWNKQGVDIKEDTDIRLDRTLQNTRQDLNYSSPAYEEMLSELHDWWRSS